MVRFSIRTAAVLFAALAMVAVTSQEAQAQGCYGNSFYGGGGYYGGYGRGVSLNVGGGYGGISVGYSNFGYNPYGGVVYRPNYNYRRPVYHDTSYIHPHPTVVVPHGNHYDVYPGFNHLHRSGHWHR